MSENKDMMLIRLSMAMGQQQSEHHSNFIQKMEDLIDIIYDEDIEILLKLRAIQKMGLADTKIDTRPEIETNLKLIDEELKDQYYMKKGRQWQNLRESDDRCRWYIIKIARLISPSALDLGAIAKEMDLEEAKAQVESL